MGGFEDALRRAVAEDAELVAAGRREVDAAEARRAAVRAENEAALRVFVASKATAREPGLQRWKLRSRRRPWPRSPEVAGWPVRVPDEFGRDEEYIVRHDGTLLSPVWAEDQQERSRLVDVEPVDLGARPLAPVLRASA